MESEVSMDTPLDQFRKRYDMENLLFGEVTSSYRCFKRINDLSDIPDTGDLTVYLSGDWESNKLWPEVQSIIRKRANLFRVRVIVVEDLQ